ncbi:MAG TPA: hypothetical protein DCP69_09920 [Candidatus Omnitrophica bacterium]|nr:hypothetical protein [Candidatus Omnitrophota bacterium]
MRRFFRWWFRDELEDEFYRGVRDGVQSVMEALEKWDTQVQHPWRLSDCLRLKLNLINKRRVRKNPRPTP